MPEYIYLIHPLRHEFFEHPTAQEEETIDAHFEYLKQAAREGVVILAGPCLDETFGVVVIQAADDAAARGFMLNDPAVKSNIMMAEIHPMKISVMREC